MGAGYASCRLAVQSRACPLGPGFRRKRTRSRGASPPSGHNSSPKSVEHLAGGSRSHFLSPDEIQAAGGAVAYVIEALDEAAKRKEWKARHVAQRQLSLF